MMRIEGHAGIQFWLNRVAEEEFEQAEKLCDKAKLRNWQVVHFKEMTPPAKEEVIRELISGMKSFGWTDEIEELIKSGD